jgi:hypothetical protein
MPLAEPVFECGRDLSIHTLVGMDQVLQGSPDVFPRGGSETIRRAALAISSDLLGIPAKALANWRSERVGPLPLRIGCHVPYRASDVSSWLEERVEAAQNWMAR